MAKKEKKPRQSTNKKKKKVVHIYIKEDYLIESKKGLYIKIK